MDDLDEDSGFTSINPDPASLKIMETLAGGYIETIKLDTSMKDFTRRLTQNLKSDKGVRSVLERFEEVREGDSGWIYERDWKKLGIEMHARGWHWQNMVSEESASIVLQPLRQVEEEMGEE